MKNWEEDDREGECSASDDSRGGRGGVLPTRSSSANGQLLDRVLGTGYSSRSSPPPPPGGRPIPTCGATRRSSSASCSDTPTTSESPGSPPDTTPGSSERGGRHRLLKGRDRAKDQSYFLYRVGPGPRSPGPSFPLATGRSRRSARWPRRPPLPNHARPDSTGICFIGERPFREFLARWIPPSAGTRRNGGWRADRDAWGPRLPHPRTAARARHRRSPGGKRRAVVRRREGPGAQRPHRGPGRGPPPARDTVPSLREARAGSRESHLRFPSTARRSTPLSRLGVDQPGSPPSARIASASSSTPPQWGGGPPGSLSSSTPARSASAGRSSKRPRQRDSGPLALVPSLF